MGICDASYKFLYVDVGAYGSEGDGGVFSKSNFGRKIYDDRLPLPADALIGTQNVPYYFVADDAFTLCKRIMKPYIPRRGEQLTMDESIFNYRLSRARRCIENTFGIMTTKWLCLNRTIQHNPDRATKIVLACCCLHNYLMRNMVDAYFSQHYGDYIDESGAFIDGEWRQNTAQWQTLDQRLGREADIGKRIRNTLKEYVNSIFGAVPWQSAAANIQQ